MTSLDWFMLGFYTFFALVLLAQAIYTLHRSQATSKWIQRIDSVEAANEQLSQRKIAIWMIAIALPLILTVAWIEATSRGHFIHFVVAGILIVATAGTTSQIETIRLLREIREKEATEDAD